MGEQIMEFENAKREFVVDRERFNAEKKGLNWRVSDAKEKLAKEQKLNAERQEEWTVALARTNCDLKLACDEAVKLKGEKDKASQEVIHLTASLKEKEVQVDTAHKANEEALARIVDLEKAVENHKAQAKASEEVAHELGEDCKWLINRGVPLLANSLMAFEDLAKYLFELSGAAYNSGRKDGYVEGKAFALEGKLDKDFKLFKEDCAGHYRKKRKEFGLL
ncbi:hypothetical protein Hanom_Chr12g01110461 [Helianthus anomalus]